MNYPETRLLGYDRLHKQLSDYGIKMETDATGCRLVSQKNRFDDFSILSELSDWFFSTERVEQDGYTAFFSGVGITMEFIHGSILLVFPSGHIRWMTRHGFCFYARLCFGHRPDYCQGDLVVFRIPGGKLLHQRTEMDAVKTDSHFWYRPREVAPELLNRWLEEESVYLGDNSRHRADGRFFYGYPVRNDCRTIQLYTLKTTVLSHDPEDDIHPPICLPTAGNYLVSKLPGFSNPAGELNESEMILS